MTNKSVFNNIAIKIFLFTLWPFLSFYAHNLKQSPSISILAWLLIIAIAFVSVLFIIVSKSKSLSTRQVSDALAVFIVVFFQYSLIKESLINLGLSPLSSNVAWLLFITIMSVGVYLLSAKEEVSKAILAMGLVLIIIPLGQVALSSTQSAGKELKISYEVLSSPLKTRPNIYYIVFDGYARDDFLQEYFQYDNAPFIEELGTYGFQVASKALANYPLTYLSISSTLQMSYVLGEGEDSLRNRKPFYRALGGNNRVVNYLKEHGYTYVHFENGLWDGTRCTTQADACLNGSAKVLGINLNETAINFLSLSPAFSLINRINKLLFEAGDNTATNALDQIADYLQVHSSQPSASPFFLFAHTLPPHPPNSYSPNCTFGSKTLRHDVLTKWDKTEYVNQIRCLNKDIIGFISTILQEDKTNPIILLTADHGAASRDQFKKNLSDWDELDFRERFTILNAALLPESCKTNFNANFTLVNTFRLVLACIQGQSPRLLEDEFYLATYESFSDYGKVMRVDRSQIEHPSTHPQ